MNNLRTITIAIPILNIHIFQATPSIQPQTSQGYHYPAPAVRFVSPQPQATIQKLVPSQGYQYPVPHVPFTTSPQQPKTASGYQYPVPNVPFVNPEPRPTAAQSQGYVYPVPSVPLITPSQSRTTTGYQYPVPQIPLVTPPQQPKTTSGYQYPVPSVPFVIPQPRPTAASSQGYAYPVPQVPLVTTPQQPKTSSGYQYPVPSVPLPVPERKPVHLPTVVEPTIVATPALTAAPTLIHKAPVEDLSSRVDLRFGVIEKSGSNLVIEKHVCFLYTTRWHASNNKLTNTTYYILAICQQWWISVSKASTTSLALGLMDESTIRWLYMQNMVLQWSTEPLVL